MFRERLAKLLKDSRLKNTELAELLGVSKSAVSKWLSGEAEPRPDILRHLAKRFDVSVGYLINEEELTMSAKDSLAVTSYGELYPSLVFSEEEPEPIQGTIWVPLFETTISATPGIQDIAREDIMGWHTAPESLSGYGNSPYSRPFSMRVRGNSMTPLIQQGDYLTVRPAPFIVPDPRHIYAIKITDDVTDTYGIVVKRVQIDANRGISLLKSDNPEFPLYVIESEKAQVLGRIINIWRPL